MFAHGISPLRDMLVNLNMTSVMIWPRSVVSLPFVCPLLSQSIVTIPTHLLIQSRSSRLCTCSTFGDELTRENGCRYNEAVKVALATRTAEVVEMYQPMTELMRQCQDGITECMEAMLVELKRDHSLVSKHTNKTLSIPSFLSPETYGWVSWGNNLMTWS